MDTAIVARGHASAMNRGGLWHPHTHWQGWYDVPSETSLQMNVPIQIIITIIWKTKDGEEECVITSPANANVVIIVLLMIVHNPGVPYVNLSRHTLQWWEMSTMWGRMTERTRHCHPLLLLLHANLAGVMILVVNAIQRPVQVVSICSSYQFIDQVDGHKTHPCPLMNFHVSVVWMMMHTTMLNITLLWAKKMIRLRPWQ